MPFVIPIPEYASVGWDGCSIVRNVQLHAATCRILTALPILASEEVLYINLETG